MKTCEFCGKEIGLLAVKYTWLDKKNNRAMHDECYKKYMSESPEKRKQIYEDKPDDKIKKEPVETEDKKSDNTEESKYKKVGGWLLFFCVVLIVFSPIYSIYTLVSGIQSSISADLFSLYPRFLILGIADTIVSIGLIIFSIYAGISLLLIRPKAVSIAKKFLIVYLIYGIIAGFFLFLAGFPPESNGYITSQIGTDIFRSLIYFGIWYAYLCDSKRVALTYSLRDEDQVLNEIRTNKKSNALKIIVICVAVLILISISATVYVYVTGMIPTQSLETQSPETQQFTSSLLSTNGNLSTSLSAINTNFYNYDTNYRWNVIYYSNSFTEFMINDMLNYENNIKTQISKVENQTNAYNLLKAKSNLNQLTTDEADVMRNIETKIDNYLAEKNKVNAGLSSMAKYREFVDTMRLKLNLLNDYNKTLTTMNSKVSTGNYETALVYAGELEQLCRDLKNNSIQKNNIGIINFSQDAVATWDLFIDSWRTYEDYLNLLIQGKDGTSKFTEYSQEYNHAVELSSSENITEIYNQMDKWYNDNIVVCQNLF